MSFEQEKIFDMVAEAIDRASAAQLERILKTLNSLATGYEYASIKESKSRHWELSSIYAIRAQGIREGIKAIEDVHGPK